MSSDTCPINPETSYCHALELIASGHYQKAEEILEHICCAFPDTVTYHLALANALHLQRSFSKAIAVYDVLVSKEPLSASAWNNRGVTLLAAGRHQEAMYSFLQALQISPELQQTKIALATCYQALGLFEQSLSCCNEVISLNHDNAEAHWNRALLLLLDGNYLEGWQEYEWRWNKEGFTSPVRHFTQPRWHGEPIIGKTILVYAEQGFGDTLQFCRYLPVLEQQGVSVVFECHQQLVTIAKTLSPTLHVVSFGEMLPHFDVQVPLLSLPALFATSLETIPHKIPYMNVPPDRTVSHMPRTISTGHNIGLCWSGKEYPDPARSCPVEYLQPLAEIAGINWYSLQVGWDKELPFTMHDLTDQIHDFADTAALMEHLDLVITIDTSVAHLAGALGKATWVLLPFSPDWRWMREREDSPWYPGMKLFRQPLPNVWDQPIREIRNALEAVPIKRLL